MINDWKYCIVQMPRSCFCPSCFTQYRGPTGTDHNETDSSVFPMTKEKIHPRRFQNFLWHKRVHSIVLPLMIKLRVAESKYHMTSDPWKVERWLLGKSALLESLGVIQVHYYLWSCPTLCSPHCVWEKEGPPWPLQGASSVPGSVCIQGKCGCGCNPLQPAQLPVPVCGKEVQAVRCPRTACRCWGWLRQLEPDAPPRVGAAVAVLRPIACASPAGCRDTGRSPGAPVASPHTLTAANTHTRRKR